jgi:hypothetical protein
MTRVIATASDAERLCPYCRFPLKEGTPAERCDACDSLHHEDCWRDGGGCAVRGCARAGQSAAAAAVAGTQAGSAGAAYPSSGALAPSPAEATQAYTGYGGSAGYPPPRPAPPSPPRSGNQTVLLLAVIIALLGIGTGVAVATGVFSGGAHANTPKTPTTPTVAASARPQTQTTASPAPSEQASDRRAVMSILGTYQSAYSDHDISELSSIFAPAITRHGLASDGCTVSRGRNAVLLNYRSQFEQGSGSYELLGLSPGKIRLDSKTRAHLDSHYRITPGGSGYVNFEFVELGEGWKISEVYATCV